MPTLTIEREQVIALLREFPADERREIYEEANREEPKGPAAFLAYLERTKDQRDPHFWDGAAEEIRRARDEDWPD